MTPIQDTRAVLPNRAHPVPKSHAEDRGQGEDGLKRTSGCPAYIWVDKSKGVDLLFLRGVEAMMVTCGHNLLNLQGTAAADCKWTTFGEDCKAL
jgi:hypothetical protein